VFGQSIYSIEVYVHQIRSARMSCQPFGILYLLSEIVQCTEIVQQKKYKRNRNLTSTHT